MLYAVGHHQVFRLQAAVVQRGLVHAGLVKLKLKGFAFCQQQGSHVTIINYYVGTFFLVDDIGCRFPQKPVI